MAQEPWPRVTLPSDLDIVSIAYFGFKDLHVWRNDNGKK